MSVGVRGERAGIVSVMVMGMVVLRMGRMIEQDQGFGID